MFIMKKDDLLNENFSFDDKSLLEVINASYLSIEDINWLKSKRWFKRFLKIYSKELKKRYKNKKVVKKEFEKPNKEEIEILDFTQSINIPNHEVIEILDFTKTIDIKDVKDITLATNKAKRRVKIEKMIWSIIIIVSVFSIIFLTFYLVNSLKESKKTTEITSKIYDISNIREVEITTNNSKSEDEKVTTTKNNKPTIYDIYGNMNMMEVDFSNLLKINSDTKGWIKVNGTKVNYPFVKTVDNDYYLTHSFDKSKNKKGWVYLDYRNDIDDLSKNTILYAHGLVNNQMFGSLRKIIKSSWYKNKDNHIIKISTLNNNQLWQVFSSYTIEPESYYITTSFNDDESFLTFLQTLKSRSIYDYGVDINKDDKILTLSSCYDDKKRMVLHAKLIENQPR